MIKDKFDRRYMEKAVRKRKNWIFYIPAYAETPLEETEAVLKKIKDHWDYWYRDPETGRL